MRRQLFTVMCIMGIALGVLWSCAREAEVAQAEAAVVKHPVNVAELAVTTEPIPIIASGKLASQAEIKLSFKIGGLIQAILVREGEAVQKGKVLAKLDMTEIRARYTQAKSALEKAERDFNRVKGLFVDSVATLEQFQNVQTAYNIALSDFNIAEFNLQHATIYAPVEGRVLRKYADPGELVAAGMPVLIVGSSGVGAQVIRIGVSDRDVIRLVLGDSASVVFDAYPEQTFSAYVSEIASAADPRTGVFEVELTLSESLPVHKNGFVGKVTLFPSQQMPYYRLPINALVEGHQNEVRVFVPDARGSIAREMVLKPIYIGNNFIAIDAENLILTEVITDGAPYLGDGDAIQIVYREKLNGVAAAKAKENQLKSM